MFTAQRSLTEWSHGFSLSSQRRSSHFSRFLIRQCVLSSLRSRSDFRSRCYSNGGSCSRSKRDLQFHRAAQCCRLQHSHVDAVIEQLDLFNEIFGGEDAAHSPRYGDMGAHSPQCEDTAAAWGCCLCFHRRASLDPRPVCQRRNPVPDVPLCKRAYKIPTKVRAAPSQTFPRLTRDNHIRPHPRFLRCWLGLALSDCHPTDTQRCW